MAKNLPTRPTAPVLAGVLLTGAEDGLTISGFDYEVSSEVQVPAEIATTGSALVSGRLLSDITRALPAKPVEVSVEGTRVSLTCGSARFSLPTMAVEDYPTLPALPDETGVVSADLFGEAIGQVAVAAGQMKEAQSAIDAAQVAVSMAQAQYAEVAGHPTAAEKLAARAAIAQAEAAVTNAQAAYNVVKGDPEIGAMPQSLVLSQATAALEGANAQAQVTASGPTAEQLAVAATAIRQAQTAVGAAQSRTPGAEANVRAALAGVASAQAALDKLLAGATPEDLAIAEAHVQSAQAAVDSAKAQLGQSEIRAPFAGQVGSITVNPGEQIAPGAYAILLGDTARMHVETTDLRETDVVRVHEGMPVEVTFDALPNRIFAGVVTQVAPVSSAEKGSTNYTVEVDVKELDPGLKWGMTAFVNIRPE